MTKTILIVEDEAEIAHLLQQLLEREGFNCIHYRDGAQALRFFPTHQPDLVILDLGLPEIDGLEVCTRIRRQANIKDPYILMLTARGEEIDRVVGLSTGADDYLVKPFSPIELVARVRALLRRSLRQDAPSQIYRTRHFTIDVEQHLAQKHPPGQPSETLDLTTLEFDLLATFINHPGRVWSRTQLVEKIWGMTFLAMSGLLIPTLHDCERKLNQMCPILRLSKQ